jgi:hypothetical protein
MKWKRKKGKRRIYGKNGTQAAIHEVFLHKTASYHLTIRKPDGSWHAIYDAKQGIDFGNLEAAKDAGEKALQNL